MEPVTRFNPDMKDLAQGNADPNVSELEGFSHHIDELLAKVNEVSYTHIKLCLLSLVKNFNFSMLLSNSH